MSVNQDITFFLSLVGVGVALVVIVVVLVVLYFIFFHLVDISVIIWSNEHQIILLYREIFTSKLKLSNFGMISLTIMCEQLKHMCTMIESYYNCIHDA